MPGRRCRTIRHSRPIIRCLGGMQAGDLRITVRPYVPAVGSSSNFNPADGIDDWIVPPSARSDASDFDDWIVPAAATAGNTQQAPNGSAGLPAAGSAVPFADLLGNSLAPL